MYTKSIIQQTVEALRVKENYRAAIENLMDRYNIEDSVFVLKNGFLHEAVSGYFLGVYSIGLSKNFELFNISSSNLQISTFSLIRVLGENEQEPFPSLIIWWQN